MDKKWLETKYVVEGLSTWDIAKKKNCSPGTVRYYLIKYGIPLRDYKNRDEKWRKRISNSMMGKRNPMFGKILDKHHGYKSGMRSYRKEAIKIYGTTCMRCGANERIEKRSNIHVHHKDNNRTNNCPENWEILCSSCHKKIHGWNKFSEDDIIIQVKKVIDEGYSYNKHRLIKRRAQYRFGSWDKAVELTKIKNKKTFKYKTTNRLN